MRHFIVCAAFLLSASLLPAQTPTERKKLRTSNQEVWKALQQPIDTKVLQDPIKFKHAMEYLSERLGAKVSILVDENAFRGDPDAIDIVEQEVVMPAQPTTASAHVVLRVLLSRLNRNATFVVREGRIEILPARHSTASALLAHAFVGVYERQPLRDVLQDLAEATGLSINLDQRLGEKGNVPITAAFLPAAGLEALVQITESANLKFVVLDRSVFVTSPENARIIEKEWKSRMNERFLELPGAGDR